MENLNEVDVVRLALEVVFQKNVDGSFQHERVVDSDHSNLGDTVPTWLATASDGIIHHVVSDKEVSLELNE